MASRGISRLRCRWVLSSLAIAGVAMGETANLGPVYWDSANERWADIAFNPYADARQTSYDYANARVSIVYAASGQTLAGTLTATGLKPNFAYQIKLNGKPKYTWADQGDDWANEQIGYAGRWWVSQIDHASGANLGGWNSTDAEYESWKARGFTDGTSDYVFEGYLLFDYIVTDAAGAATREFTLDRSLHVLWKVSQRPRTASDSAPTHHRVVASSASPWYAASYPTRTVDIYGEWEPGRALPGRLVLPIGLYNVRLFLTEESFHQGPWATVMVQDSLTFLLYQPNRPPVARPDAAATPYCVPVTLAVLANDKDPDGDPLTVSAVGRPHHGKAAINPDQTVTYTPNVGFTGADSFIYTASDGQGGTAQAKVTVTVQRAVPCSISGGVASQKNGKGIHWVTLVLQQRTMAHWRTIASTYSSRHGFYRFRRWLLGTYRVVPAYRGLVFSPASETVVIGSVGQREVRSFTASRK